MRQHYKIEVLDLSPTVWLGNIHIFIFISRYPTILVLRTCEKKALLPSGIRRAYQPLKYVTDMTYNTYTVLLHVLFTYR